MIQIGIVGSGFIGPAHIEALRRLGFVEVRCVAGSGTGQGAPAKYPPCLR